MIRKIKCPIEREQTIRSIVYEAYSRPKFPIEIETRERVRKSLVERSPHQILSNTYFELSRQNPPLNLLHSHSNVRAGLSTYHNLTKRKQLAYHHWASIVSGILWATQYAGIKI